mgnify:CR=1 FL=1
MSEPTGAEATATGSADRERAVEQPTVTGGSTRLALR